MRTKDGLPSSWALIAQREADKQNPTYLEDELEEVEAHTLVLVGREDPCCSVRAAERALVGIEGSKLIVLEDCGHFAWIGKREEFMDVVGRLLLE